MAECAHCPATRGLRVIEITDPKTYAVKRLLLCSRCRDATGIAPAQIHHPTNTGGTS